MVKNYLEISTTNIKPATEKYLALAAQKIEENYFCNCITVFRRNAYGYFVIINECTIEDYPDIPNDLKKAIELALKEYCDYIIIDADAEIDVELENYTELWKKEE